MNDEVAIKVEEVSKKYCKSLKRSMIYGIKDIARNTLGLSSHSDNLRKEEFWAVDDVSFEVKRGETLGIIGPNGAGKTTLLKMLNGIFWPDKGKITIKGRVGALIAVGAGFHPMLTGRENIYINGAILGMSKQEIDKKFDAIVEFADIGDFLDTPVKFYSSGMFVRLGFAVAIHCEPDVLLVDEVLAVGDMNFRRKCLDRIKEVQNEGTTVIFVSHFMPSIEGVCEVVIFLNKGRIKAIGNPLEVISRYKDCSRNVKDKMIISSSEEINWEDGYSTEKLKLGPIYLLDKNNKKKESFSPFEKVKLRIHYHAHKRIKNPIFDVSIWRNDGVICSRERWRYNDELIEGSGVIEMEFEETRLTPGSYFARVFVRHPFQMAYLACAKHYRFQIKSVLPTSIHEEGLFYLLSKRKKVIPE